MSCPPPAAEPTPVDLEHLRRATFGDADLEREVLGMFLTQATRLIGALAEGPPHAAALAHSLKGSARAIGACRVAERASALEAAIRDGGDPRAGARRTRCRGRASLYGGGCAAGSPCGALHP